MISAHMDEVGMIITSVTSDGMLRFAPVGGIDSRVLIGRSVLVGEKMYGVIGTKAVHLQSPEERKTAVKSDDLFIDIGAIDKEDALKHISLGESVCFDSPFVSFGNGFLKGKAIDDRFGCALMIRMIQSDLEYDTTFVFCVQEEVGLRGAKAAAYTVNPDFAIVCEATTAADVADVPDNKKVCKLGNGAVVSYMDHRTVYDKELYDLAFSTAQEHQIACQTKTMVAGGNDAGAIQYVARRCPHHGDFDSMPLFAFSFLRHSAAGYGKLLSAGTVNGRTDTEIMIQLLTGFAAKQLLQREAGTSATG